MSEAKDHASERLRQMDESGEMHSTEAHADNVIIGHKVRMDNACE